MQYKENKFKKGMETQKELQQNLLKVKSHPDKKINKMLKTEKLKQLNHKQKNNI